MSPEALGTWGPIVVMIAIFYFLLYRPQKKQQNRRRAMLDNLKKGDQVITIGGIYGTIVELGDTSLKLKIADGVVIEGIDNCPIKFAKCCSPLPGDEIVGFVTRGFGVSIHKRQCKNVMESMRHPENADRWVRAYWDDAVRENYKATLELTCMDRANLVSDVALALGDMRVPIYSLTARAAEHGRARMSVTVGITNTEHLNSVVARLKKVKDVISVVRS